MQEVGAEGDGSAHAMKGMGESFGKSQTEECEVASYEWKEKGDVRKGAVDSNGLLCGKSKVNK